MRVVASAVCGFCSKLILIPCALLGAVEVKNTSATPVTINNWTFVGFFSIQPSSYPELYQLTAGRDTDCVWPRHDFDHRRISRAKPSSAQKFNRATNSRLLAPGSFVLLRSRKAVVVCPNELLTAVVMLPPVAAPPGTIMFGWLKTFSACTRNSKFKRSLICVRFTRLTSHLESPGPQRNT